MNLHENSELFKDAITATSQARNIPEIYIEKDYWVTLALSSIFNSEIGESAIFKGGTAIAKCNRLIERFSEDIDIVLLNDGNTSANQLKSKLKKISKAVEKIIPEVETKGITNKKGMIRKTAHRYEKNFSGDFGQVRDNIIVEATWLGSFEPYEEGEVSSLIYEMMLETNQTKTAEEYNLKPFKVNVLSPKRTLCEKIMSLVRFSHTDNPILDLKNKVRHTYDLHQLLKDLEINTFFNSDDFDEMFLKVANDDVLSFKNNNKWLEKHPTEAIIFSEPQNTWNSIKSTYNGDFKQLVYGDFPSDIEVFETIELISNRLRKIDWDIDFTKLKK